LEAEQKILTQPFMELSSFVFEGSIKGRTQKVFAQPQTFSPKSWRLSKKKLCLAFHGTPELRA
jgi:hypothetical protein